MEIKNKEKKENSFSAKILKNIISGSILAIFFLVPLFFTGLTAQGAGFEKLLIFEILLLIGMISWVARSLILGKLTLKKTVMDVAVISFLFFYLVSSVFSVDKKASFFDNYANSGKGFFSVAIYALFYYFLVNNMSSRLKRGIFRALVFGIGLTVIYAFLQIVGIFILPFEQTRDVSFNTVGSFSSLAMFLAASLPILMIGFAVPEAILAKSGRKAVVLFKIFSSFFLALALALMVILNNFNFWYAPLLGILVFLIFSLAKVVKINSYGNNVAIGIFILLIFFATSSSLELVKINLPTEVSLSRGVSWDIVKNTFNENKFLGSGPSTFYYAFAKFKSESFNYTPAWELRFNNATGLTMEFLATTGALGVLGIVLVSLMFFTIVFLFLTKSELNKSKYFVLALLASFVVLCFEALVFSLNSFLIIFGVMISGLCLALCLDAVGENVPKIKLSLKFSPKYALALSAILLFVFSGVVILFSTVAKIFIADIYAAKAKEEVAKGDLGRGVEYLAKSTVLAPHQSAYQVGLARYYMSLANVEAAREKGKTDISLVGKYIQAAISVAKKAVDENPQSVETNEIMALIYENASLYIPDANKFAQDFYLKVIDLDPNNPLSYLKLANLKSTEAGLSKDENIKTPLFNEAESYYLKAIEKKSDFASAHYSLGLFYKNNNNFDKAIQELAQANAYSPKNTDFLFDLAQVYYNKGLDGAVEKIEAEEAFNILSTSSPDLISRKKTIEKNQYLKNAELIFERILGLNKNHANALYLLGTLQEKTGNKEGAKEKFSYLLDILTDGDVRKAIERKYNEL